MAMSFTLLAMQALSPGLDSSASWQRWAEQPGWPQDAAMPMTPQIPPMVARRLSQSARLAVQLGLEMVARWQPARLLCVSRHGELVRTFGLLQQLIRQQPLSPTDFSMSVHNTVAGLITIVGQQTMPASSLAAGPNSFQAGLTEACATLAVEPGPLLLLYFDGMVPEFYHPWVPERESAHAVALVMQRGEQWQYQGRAAAPAQPFNQALAFWRHHLLNDATLVLPGPTTNQGWSWARS
jgi:hypothetical protein